VLDEHSVLEHGDLRAPFGLSHHHNSVDSLATREEFRLGEDRSTPASCVSTVTAALTLSLKTDGTLEPGRLFTSRPRFAHMHGRALGIIRIEPSVLTAAATAATPTGRRTPIVIVV
jgi:hypothetical protein